MKNKSTFFRVAALWVMLFSISSGIFAQGNAKKWDNYNVGNCKNLIVSNFCVEGNNYWFVTNDGLVSLNTVSNEFSYYNNVKFGLPVNGITAICPYTTGKIAFGTASGVGIFDGTKCEIFNKANSPLISKYPISKMTFIDGKLYVASIQRLFIYDQTSWKTIFYGAPWMSATDFISDIKADVNGSVYALKMNGIFKVVGDSLKPVLPLRKAYREFQLISDTLWMTGGYGLYCQKDTAFKSFNMTNSALPGNRITQLKLDSKNRLWFLTEKGLTMFNPSNSECVNFKNDSIRFAGIVFMSLDQNENIVVIENNLRNIWKFNGTSWTRSLYTKPVPEKPIHNFILDKKNKLWIYSPEKGFSKFDKNGTTVFDSTKISKIVPLKTLYEDLTRKIFFADEDVIFDYNNITFEATVIKSGFTNRMASAAYDTLTGIYWKATSAGLEKCSDSLISTVDLVSLGAASNNIAGIYLEKSGALLISTLPADSLSSGALLRYENAALSMLYSCDTAFMVSGIVTAKDSSIWIGVRDAFATGRKVGRGILRYDGSTWKEFNMLNSKMPRNSVNDLCADMEGNLWIGTNAGLAKFDRKFKWTIFNKYNSILPIDTIVDVAVDAENSIWAGTQEGTISYIPQVKAPTAITSPSAETANLMDIYPVPCSDVLNISFKASAGMESALIAVYNLTGQKMFEVSRTVSADNLVTLPVSSLSQGIYMLKVSNKSYTFSKMLMVK
jgi:ligand-binding sensor domain-containing protein